MGITLTLFHELYRNELKNGFIYIILPVCEQKDNLRLNPDIFF